MPTNHEWKRLNSILYKEQDYQYSCFFACLQIVLENWKPKEKQKKEKQVGREVEDDFNRFLNLDAVAPTIELITQYMNQRKDITYAFIKEINDDVHKATIEHMKNFQNCAIIGAIIGVNKDSGGHALCLMKLGDSFYGFNPCIPEVVTYNCNPLQLLKKDKSAALDIPDIGCFDCFYMIIPK